MHERNIRRNAYMQANGKNFRPALICISNCLRARMKQRYRQHK